VTGAECDGEMGREEGGGGWQGGEGEEGSGRSLEWRVPMSSIVCEAADVMADADSCEVGRGGGEGEDVERTTEEG
jgi:hypothetical protein